MDTTAVMQAAGNVTSKAAQAEALLQIGRLIAEETSLPLRSSPSGGAFLIEAPEGAEPRKGIVTIRGSMSEDDDRVDVEFELARVPRWVRVAPDALFRKLSVLGGKVRVSEPTYDASGSTSSLAVKLAVHPEPMTMTREVAFLTQVRTLDAVAHELQSELPLPITPPELEELFEHVRKHVEPIAPMPSAIDQIPVELTDWAMDTADCLTGGACVAIVSPSYQVERFVETLVAWALGVRGVTLGRLTAPAIGADDLIRLNRKSPGVLAVPADTLSFGGSPYDMGDRVQPLMRTLRSDSPVIFSGTFAQLQYSVSGGQGSVADPLSPIVRHAPSVPLPLLAARAVREAGAKHGGLTPAEEESLVVDVLDALGAAQVGAEPIGLLSHTAHKVVSDSRTATAATQRSAADHVALVGSMRQTLSGLSGASESSRSPEVTARFARELTDPGLLTHLQEELVGQEQALTELAARARTESLTRPDNQPLRWVTVGTAGTGKSVSSQLISRRLGIPYVNVDCASFATSQGATTALLGSPRGYVGSYQAGVLEQAAKHAGGAFIELSDLDHAPASARSAIADLLLGALEAGELQSATGSRFSCAELVICFTLNLPGSMDEGVRKTLGFGGDPSRHELQDRVTDEATNFLSGAFMSRIGSPIVFDPLGPEALAAIAERAVSRAIRSAARRRGVELVGVKLDDGVGDHIVAAHQTRTTTYGARALLEHGREAAAEAFVEWFDAGVRTGAHALMVVPAPAGGIKLVEDNRPRTA